MKFRRKKRQRPLGSIAPNYRRHHFERLEDRTLLAAVSVQPLTIGEGQTANFLIQLSPFQAGRRVFVSYATENGSAVGQSFGTPAVDDFFSDSGTVTFEAFETQKTVSILTIDDAIDEDNESFKFKLTSASTDVFISNDPISINTPVVTNFIVDNDNPPALSIGDSSDYETGAANFNVILSRPSGKTITVNYSTIPGSAATGTDFFPNSGSLTFSPGQTSKTITVQHFNDVIDEDNESYTVQLTSPQNASIADGTGIGTIIDDDNPPNISISSPSIMEGNVGTRSLVFDVTLSQASGKQVQVNYSTVPVSAQPNQDYMPVSGPLTFAAGETAKQVAIAIIGDLVIEPNEAFRLELSAANNASILFPGYGIGTIDNDDFNPPPIASAGPDQTGVEGQDIVLTGTFTDDSAVGHTHSWVVRNSSNVIVGSSSLQQFTFVPPDNGTFAATYTVTDSGGLSGADTASIVISNANPSIIGVSVTNAAVEGAAVFVTVTATDPAGSNDPLTYDFDFDNDGTFEVSGPSTTAQRIYSDNAVYTVRVRVRDDDNGVSAVEMQQVSVLQNLPPNVNLGADRAANLGDNVSLTGMFSDPGTADTHTLSWQVTSSNGQVFPTGNQTNYSFLPLGAGTYTVSLTVTDDEGASGTDQLIVTVNMDVAPLRFDGNFTLNPTSGMREATGVIFVGHIPIGAATFSPVARIDGTVRVSAGLINSVGVVSATSPAGTPLLFNGTFSIPVGMTQSTVQETQPTNAYKLAGLDVEFTGIDIRSDRLALNSTLILPAALGGIALPFGPDRWLTFGQNLVRLEGGDARVLFPVVSLLVRNSLELRANNLALEYIGATNELKLQGTVKVPGVYNFTGNFSGSNYIKVIDGQVDMKGKVSIEDFDWLGGNWGFKELYAEFDTMTGVLGGGAMLKIPTGIVLEASVHFELIAGRWGIDEISLGVDNINRPIGTTGAFLQRIAGTVGNLAQSNPFSVSQLTFTGEVGITAGPALPFNVPLPSWAGGTIDAGTALVRIDGTATIDNHHVEEGATTKVLETLLTGTTTAGLNWDQGLFYASGPLSLANGLVTVDTNFAVDKSYNVTLRGSGTVHLPNLGGLLRGQTIASGNGYFQYRNNPAATDDYFFAYGQLSVPILGSTVLGVKVDFTGDVDTVFSMAELSRLTQPGGSGASINESASWEATVDAGKAMFFAEWDNDIGLAPETLFELVSPGPNGIVYTLNNLVSHPNVGIVDLLTSPRSIAIAVDRPLAGKWTLRIRTDQDVNPGVIRFAAFKDTAAPSIRVLSATIDQTGTTGTIRYAANDPDSNARISFFYNNGSDALNGVLIADGIMEADGEGSFQFNAGNWPSGMNNVYAIIDDGQNVLVSDAIEIKFGHVTGSVWRDYDSNGLRDGDEPGLANWRIYVDANGNGQQDGNEFSALTDTSGQYSFNGLNEGTYILRQVVPTGWEPTHPSTGFYSLDVSREGQAVFTIKDFGNFPTIPGEIRGSVWNDANGNGIRESGERGLPGHTLFLDQDGDGLLDAGETSTISNASGVYTFPGLPARSYAVRAVEPAGSLLTHPSDGVHIVPDMDPGQLVVGQDFGFFTIGGEGPEFPTNTTLSGTQQRPQIAMDQDGDFVIVWDGNGVGDNAGVFFQRYDSSGLEVGSETLVNTTTSGLQGGASVAISADGDFVVVWESGNVDGSATNIFARRFTSAGLPIGNEFQVNRTKRNRESDASISMDAMGNFVVSWEDIASDPTVYARLFDRSGVPKGAEFVVNTTQDGTQRRPTAAMDATGRFVIAWEGSGAGDNAGVFAQLFDDNGSRIGSEFLVNEITAGTQGSVSAAMAADGRYAIIWASYSGDRTAANVFARHFGVNGVPVNDEFQLNILPVDSQFGTSLAMASDGNAMAAWTQTSDGIDGSGIFAARFGLSAAIASPVFKVNSFVVGNQRTPAVAASDQGQFVASWESVNQDGDGPGIYAHRFAVSEDNLGPMVAGLFDPGDQHSIKSGERLVHGLSQIVVTYSEELSIIGGAGGSHSALNPSNWHLMYNGQEIVGAAANVTFGLDVASNKYRAVLTLDGNGTASGTPALSTGRYSLLVSDSITDVDGNALDGDFDGEAGGDFAWQFVIAPPNLSEDFTVNGSPAVVGVTSHVDHGPDGSFVVVWEGTDSDGLGIFGQRYSATGVPLGDNFQVNTFATGEQSIPRVAVHDDGSFIVAWTSRGGDGNGSGVSAQRFDASGKRLGGEFVVNATTAGEQAYPDIAIDSHGDFVFTWSSLDQDGSGWGVFAQRFNANATKNGPELAVNTYVNNHQLLSQISMDEHGNFVIAWQSSGQDGSDYGIYARRYDATGKPLDNSEFRVNTQRAGDQRSAQIAMDADGDFVIAWLSQMAAGLPYEVTAQRYDQNGIRVGEQFKPASVASQAPANGTSVAQVDMDANGDFVVTWRTDADIRARRFSAAGMVAGDEVVITRNTTQNAGTFPAVAVDSDGDFLLVWGDRSQRSNQWDVLARRFAAPNSIQGSAWNDLDSSGTQAPYEPRLTDRKIELQRLFVDSQPIQSFYKSTPKEGDQFGVSVAALGTGVLVGAFYDDTFAADGGAVYLFDSTTGNLIRTFHSPAPNANDRFGRAIAGSGNFVVVGAPRDDSAGPDAGAVFVFDAETGTLVQTLLNPHPNDGNLFGGSVAVVDNQIVVGAPGDTQSNGGAAYLFDASTGSLVHELTNPAPQVNDAFGGAVAISGTSVLIGDTADDTTGGAGAGAAYVFDRTTGDLIHTFVDPMHKSNDFFGKSVAATADMFIIGAHADDTAASNAGIAYLFDAASYSLLQTFHSPSPRPDDFFGQDVAFVGTNVLVGANFDDRGAPDAGAAYLFDSSTGLLLQTFGKLSPKSGDYFGQSVASMGDRVIVGVLFDHHDGQAAGGAYLFETSHTITSVTDANGQFTFAALHPGKYLLRQELPAGWKQTVPGDTVMANQTAYVVDVISNDIIANMDFGSRRLSAPIPGDYDNNGTVAQEDYDFWRNTFGSISNLFADGNSNGVVDAADYIVWRHAYSLALPPTLTGDYNRNGVVEQHDYSVWRTAFGTTVASPGLGADGNHDDIVDTADYVMWRHNLPTIISTFSVSAIQAAMSIANDSVTKARLLDIPSDQVRQVDVSTTIAESRSRSFEYDTQVDPKSTSYYFRRALGKSANSTLSGSSQPTNADRVLLDRVFARWSNRDSLFEHTSRIPDENSLRNPIDALSSDVLFSRTDWHTFAARKSVNSIKTRFPT